MAVISIKNKTKSGSLLAGNEAFDPNAYVPIATITFASAGSGFDFQNIPQTYKHLELRFMAYSTLSASVDNLAMYLNNDVSSVYATHALYGNGSSVSTYAGTSQQRFYLPSLLSANSTAQYTVGTVTIHDYASTTKYKTTRAFHGYDANGSGIVGMSSGLFQSTGAVTRFSGGTSANIAAGSVFSLYGIKGE